MAVEGTLYSLHTTDCASALEQNAQSVSAADWPDVSWHRCGYYQDPRPDQALLTQTEGDTPPIIPE